MENDQASDPLVKEVALNHPAWRLGEWAISGFPWVRSLLKFATINALVNLYMKFAGKIRSRINLTNGLHVALRKWRDRLVTKALLVRISSSWPIGLQMKFTDGAKITRLFEIRMPPRLSRMERFLRLFL